MTRKAITVLLLAAAVLVQATVLNRLPVPWGAGPDLVLIVVTAIALTGAPAAGAAAGFAGGLAMDVLPPADHEIGRYTMMLCLAGYLVALLQSNSATGTAASGWRAVGVAAVAAVGVALGYAGVGVVVGDPRIGAAAVAVGTLGSLLATVLVSPLVLLPLLKVLRSLSTDEFTTIQGPTRISGW